MATTSVICPHCHKEFPLEATDYADIAKQVRDQEFAAELAQREKLMGQAREQEVRAAASEAREEMQKSMAEQAAHIQVLQQQLAESKNQSQLELEKAQAKASAAAAQAQAELQAEVAQLRLQLEAQAQSAQTTQQLAIAEATKALEKERDEMVSMLKVKEAEQKSAQQEFERKLAETEHLRDEMLRAKDDELQRVRDLKAKLSTKMVGETLEQHCENEYNGTYATVFPNATFGKDNDALKDDGEAKGSKGDYIFREVDEDGVELISIMFEMKNEADTSSTKQRNAAFFDKLDKDRTKKGCEYAVLVSLLEPENELYNRGIYEVPGYSKMYVIRPQLFLSIISLLRNMASRSMEDRKQLALMRSREVDVTNFEDKLDKFKSGFAKNMDLASRKFDTAIAEIDKTIDHLEKVKAALLSSGDNLGYASGKLDKISVKSLTRGNATMKALFEEAREQNNASDESDEADVLEYDDSLDDDE